jgi:tRNA A37 N6-isopentenylltransferase MiaA
MPPKILVIVGPTASGKTRLAVELLISQPRSSVR